MSALEITFVSFLLIIFHAYLGYAVIVYFLMKLTGKYKTNFVNSELPEVSFIVPCFNEADIVEEKALNTLQLNYPKDKLKIYFITDGSNDGTPQVLSKFSEIKVLHQDERRGKAAAINRAMDIVQSEVACFSDANTHLPQDALVKMMKHYADPMTGAVSGEKRVFKNEKDNASASGEGFYWKYESFLKRLDSDFYSLVGAAGELVSFRKNAYTRLEEDSVLDDFMISMRIAADGYRVIYEPDAYAMETASASVKEELKRKVRICAGGWQSMIRLFKRVSPLKNFRLFYLYYSHRVLRWSIVPVLLLLLIPLNVVIMEESIVYKTILIAQMGFYSCVLLGYILENNQIRFKPLFIPYYFFIMNYSVFAGFVRYLKGSQSAAWERSKRAEKKVVEGV